MSRTTELLEAATARPWRICPNLAGICEDPNCDWPGDISSSDGMFIMQPTPSKPEHWVVPEQKEQQANGQLVAFLVNTAEARERVVALARKIAAHDGFDHETWLAFRSAISDLDRAEGTSNVLRT